MNRITTQQFQRLSASYTEEQARPETEIPKKEAQLREADHVDSGAEDFIHKANLHKRKSRQDKPCREITKN